MVLTVLAMIELYEVAEGVREHLDPLGNTSTRPSSTSGYIIFKKKTHGTCFISNFSREINGNGLSLSGVSKSCSSMSTTSPRPSLASWYMVLSKHNWRSRFCIKYYSTRIQFQILYFINSQNRVTRQKWQYCCPRKIQLAGSSFKSELTTLKFGSKAYLLSCLGTKKRWELQMIEFK